MLVTRTINNLEIKSPSSEHSTISNNLAYGGRCRSKYYGIIWLTQFVGESYIISAQCEAMCCHHTANNTNWPLQHITFEILPHLFVLFNSIRLYAMSVTVRWCVERARPHKKAWQISWCGWCEHHKWMEQIKSSKSDWAMSVTKYPARVLGRCAIKIILGCRIASSRLVGALYTRCCI